MQTKPKHSRSYIRRNLRLESLERRLCLTTIAQPFPLPEPSYCNAENPQDVNQDNHVTPLDALLVINELNTGGARALGEGGSNDPVAMVDVNGDSQLSAVDALLVINSLNDPTVESTPTSLAEPNPTDEADPVDSTDGSSSDESPVDENPAEESTGSDASEEEPTNITSITPETPADDTSPDQTLEDETPVDDESNITHITPETPEDETPGDDTPPDETPDDQTPDDQIPDNNTDDGSDEEESDESDDCRGSVGHRRDRFFERLDANEDGLLTADEVPEGLWEQLAEADTDGDGAVSADEVAAFAAEHRQRPRGPFAAFDENDDGLLTEDEVPERIWEHLSPADADGDGAVSPDELAALVSEHHEHPRGPFAAFDANNDGLLTEDEVPEQVWARLSPADADSDGAVSPEEIAALVTGHEEHPRGPLADFDANDDGVLTVDEVPEGIWNRLISADADGDGALSADELDDLEVPPGPRPDHPARPNPNAGEDAGGQQRPHRRGGRR